MRDFFPDHRFRPFLMLHEFEALLFVDPDIVAQGMKAPAKAQVLQEAETQPRALKRSISILKRILPRE